MSPLSSKAILPIKPSNDTLGMAAAIASGSVELASFIAERAQQGIFLTVLGFGIAIILGNGLVQGLVYGPIAAFVAEQFPTRLRFTGASASYQTASTIGAGLSPMVAASLVIAVGASWPVAVLWMVVLAAAAAAVLFTREGTRVNIGTIK